MLLFGTHLKHGRHFDYWNQLLNMCLHICHLDCHEVGVCCYLVIHIENLLHPLQLFNFHLWPIYCPSLVLLCPLECKFWKNKSHAQDVSCLHFLNLFGISTKRVMGNLCSTMVVSEILCQSTSSAYLLAIQEQFTFLWCWLQNIRKKDVSN
jgi:hypothetical protein